MLRKIKKLVEHLITTVRHSEKRGLLCPLFLPDACRFKFTGIYALRFSNSVDVIDKREVRSITIAIDRYVVVVFRIHQRIKLSRSDREDHHTEGCGSDTHDAASDRTLPG